MNRTITVGEALSMLQTNKMLTHLSNGELSHKAYSVDDSTVLTYEYPENDSDGNAVCRFVNKNTYIKLLRDLVESGEFIVIHFEKDLK